MSEEIELRIVRVDEREIFTSPGVKRPETRVTAVLPDGRVITARLPKLNPTEAEIQAALLKEIKPAHPLTGRRWTMEV